MYCTHLQCPVLTYSAVYSTQLQCTVLTCSVLYSPAVYSTHLQCTVLTCSAVYSTHLQCTSIGPDPEWGMWARTDDTKLSSMAVFSGHPWSGHRMKWKCLIIRLWLPCQQTLGLALARSLAQLHTVVGTTYLM